MERVSQAQTNEMGPEKDLANIEIPARTEFSAAEYSALCFHQLCVLMGTFRLVFSSEYTALCFYQLFVFIQLCVFIQWCRAALKGWFPSASSSYLLYLPRNTGLTWDRQ